MTSEQASTDTLIDILDAAQNATQFIQGMTFDTFAADHKTVYAVVHALELLGKTTQDIPQSVQERYFNVPWQTFAELPNVLTANYMRGHLASIWKLTSEELPSLLPIFRRMVEDARVRAS
ncbi:MAG: HepT-like ribonuclease domain-containing protein [Chloroflexota bacterium]